MSKYIDADKLISEIERLLKCTERHRGEAVADGSRQTLYWIKDFIDSLQQEQPECIYGRTFKEREKYCKFCSAVCEVRVEQEQPGVDLEKEIKNYLATKCAGDDEPSVSEIARHFYELGLNTRKEE